MQTQHAIALMFAIFADCLSGVTARRPKLENGVKKLRFFFTPPIFDATVRRSQSEYCLNVWYVKIRIVELPKW